MDYLINKPTSIENIDFKHVNDNLPRYGKHFNYNHLKSNWCVYAHINKCNKKIYIGISSDLKSRWGSNGTAYKGCKKFYNAIQCYGWNNFEHLVLMNGLTSEMASEIEIQLIYKYDSKKNGYNSTNGGISTRKVINNSCKPIHQYDLNGIYIQSFDSRTDAIELITGNRSSGFRFSSRGNNFAYGFLWSDILVDQVEPYRPITAKYLDEYHTPSRNSDRIILKIDFYGHIVSRYNSVYEIFDDCDQRYWLLNCLKSKNMAHRYDGYIWIYEDEYNEDTINDYIKNQKIHKSVHVKMYDLNGNYLNTFCNSVDAQNKTGISFNRINACCNKISNTAGGYQWIFEGDIPPKKYVNNNTKSLSVAKIDIATKKILGTYKSLRQASFSLGNTDKSKIIKRAAQGFVEFAYGYIWRYVDSNGEIINPK